MYELLFEGKLLEGVAMDDAKANMARMFKASPAQIDRMFSGGPVILRNKLDEDTGLKYQLTLKKIGVVTQLRLMAGEAAEPASAAPPAPVAAAAPARPASPPPASVRPASSGAAGEATVPGDRLKVAGERVDDVLKGKDWTIAPVGVRMEDEKAVVAPVFEHLDEISIAPVGARMSDEDKVPPPPPPDTSHLSVKKD